MFHDAMLKAFKPPAAGRFLLLTRRDLQRTVFEPIKEIVLQLV
jgi:hypothetical protein